MTIDWLLIFARDLALVVWLGGLIVIDFVETPARFRVAEINRNQVVAVGRAVFAAMGRVEVIVGALLLATCLLLSVRPETSPRSARASALTVGVMWLFALIQFFWLRPRLTAVTQGLDLVNRSADEPRFRQLKKMHRAYTALDLLKIALGIVTLALNV